MTVTSAPINSNLILFAQIINLDLGIPEECVDDFLGFIDCHPELRALTTIAHQLINVLPIAGQVTDDFYLRDNISEWRRICEYVVEYADAMATDFPEINQQSKNGKRAPFSKQFERYPLYTAIWYDYPEEEHQRRYRLLQTLLLLSQYEFRRLEDKQDKHYDSISLASTRLIRQFAELNYPEKIAELRPLLVALPDRTNSLGDYLDFIYTLEEDVDYGQEPFVNAIDVLRRMLRYAVEHKGGYTRTHSRTWEAILNREALREMIVASDSADEHAASFSVEAIQMYSQTEKQEQKAREAGCAVGEVKTGVEHLIINDERIAGNPMAGRSPIAHVRRSREKYKAIAIANQLINYRWDVLTAHELTVFLHEVSNLVRCKRSGKTFSHTVSNLELAALLTTLYWTGASLETAIMVRFENERKVLPKTLKADDFRFILESHEWVHGSLRPSYHSSLDQETKVLVYDTYNLVILPIHNKTAEIIRRWIIDIEDERKRIRCKRLFYLSESVEKAKPHYESAITTFLKQLNRQYKTRLTITRISHDLMGRLYQTSGDLTEAMIITGRNHYLGTVQLHYASPPLSRLQTVYTDTCRQITATVYQSLHKPLSQTQVNSRQFTQADADQHYTGGRYYLKKGVVAELVQNLIVRFSDTLKFSGSVDYWVELHNDYTLYVAELLGFASGYRAVQNPFACIDQVDWQTGFCCISDKDDLDYYNARLVWLPVIVRQQLRHYQTHCHYLGERLMLINPTLAKKLLSHGETLVYTVPFLFLMKPNGRILKLTPDEIKKRLSDFFRVPCNVNRSYLRNRLRELGCSGEIVNYFLGHWENGEEPFGVYSSLSPMAYRNEIAPRLNALLAEDGWRCIEGFSRLV